jgi:predicted Fe-S protein YdhL (DUF1289 family)
MSDDIWQRDEIESPCVKVCVIHPQTRLCLGCRRSIDEIARWSQMTPAERRTVMAALPGRTAAPARRRGGAGARRGT